MSPVVAVAALLLAAPPLVKPAVQKPARVAFTRYLDRTEGAFLVLVPSGWQTQGGIVRVNPMVAGGAGQSIEAKIDFLIARDREGRVGLRFLPHVNSIVPSPYTLGMPVMNGMPVAPMPTAEAFLTSNFQRLRPQARDVKVVETMRRPDLEAAARAGPKAQSLMRVGAQYGVSAAIVTVTYEENGTRFKEALFTAIEGFSVMGTAMWSNALTIVARAPEAEYAAYSPLSKVILNSFTLNPRWVAAEAQGQQARAKVVTDTQKAIAQIDREITENRQRTQERIADQQYLTLTGQERYVNPHTGAEELGSNEWKHRWENAWGEVIYTDNADWNPNLDPALNVQGYERSAVKRR